MTARNVARESAHQPAHTHRASTRETGIVKGKPMTVETCDCGAGRCLQQDGGAWQLPAEES